MRAVIRMLLVICGSVVFGGTGGLLAAEGTTPGLSALIDGFMHKEFPQGQVLFWIMEVTPESDAKELLLDLHAMVVARQGEAPSERRFLLLVVEGRLRGVQRVPLDPAAVCQPDVSPDRPKQL